jgi:glycerophosphoryl diester phosphodiesterase
MFKQIIHIRKSGHLLVLFIAVLLSLISVPNLEAVADQPSILGAHRGDSTNYVENTIEAIQSAVNEDKYKFIEFDIQYTKDKKIIIFHDLSLLRLQNKKVEINKLTYQELLEISDFQIPLYEEVMDIIADSKKINIEIKSQSNLKDDRDLIDFIIKDCKEREILKNILISSISPEAIKYVDNAHPEIKTGQIFWIVPSTFFNLDFFTKSLYNEISETGADYLMLHGVNLRNYSSLLNLKPTNKTLVFWNFDDTMYVLDDKLW